MTTDYKKFLLRKSVELDFPEIEEQPNSEIPLELRCRVENVLSVLREVIEKFKVSLVLPKILENPKVLRRYLENNTKYNQCLQLIKEYRKESKYQLQSELNQSNEHETLKIVDYFQEHYQILNVLPNWLDDIDATEQYFLKALKDVCEIAEERFLRSAITDLAKEKRVHAFYLANEETVQNLKKIKQKIKQKKVNMLWQYAAHGGIIQKLEEELSFRQYDSRLLVRRELCKCQREIQRANNAFVAKQPEFEEDLKKARASYEAKLKTDLKEEKIVQEERNKIQLQLQALIQKYDQTMYDKRMEEARLQDEYNKEKLEFDEFLKEFKREEGIYEESVVKQQQLHEAKVRMFVYRRAALKIQKWWRRLQKQLAKERNKRMKKKKTVK